MYSTQNLFIIDSPFQALCSLEAIAHYGVVDPLFVLFEEENIGEKNNIISLIKGHGTIKFINHKNGGTISLIKATRHELKNSYSKIFIGDYFSYSQYVVAICLAKFGAKFIFLDDGNSTVSIAPPIYRKRGWSDNERIAYHFWDVIMSLKCIKRSFFTIYNLEGNFQFPVEKNSFSTLRSSVLGKQYGIYIIGTNSSAQKFRNANYEDYLKKLATYIQHRYSEQQIYYCPHRRDSNDYTHLVKNLGWSMFHTEISVEIDFIRKGIKPLCIFGFGSTALFTLKNIFPNTVVGTVVVYLESEDRNRRYRNIERHLNKNGVDIIDLGNQ